MTPEAFARSLISEHEGAFSALCLADFDDALQRADSERERKRLIQATLHTYLGGDSTPAAVPVIAPAEVIVVEPLTVWRLKNQFHPRPQSRPRAKTRTPRGASW